MILTRRQLEEKLRKAGLRVTPQRFAILKHLVQSHDHPTADDIQRSVNRHFPAASRASVYNVVNVLRDAGMIREIFVDGPVVRYDANQEPHHHFSCRRCGRLYDLPWRIVPKLNLANVPDVGQVESYSISLRGVCGECSK